MCGFAGIVAFDERYAVDRGVLSEMSTRLAHRGPDGEGLVQISGPEAGLSDTVSRSAASVGLVHRRLAVLDPDSRSNQPFTDGAGRWLIFNGEIYNFKALRAELASLREGYAWKTAGDTEVLLAAYAEWGERCCERLEGMFAFAIWDAPRSRLLLARDRMGQKPLYFSQRQGSHGPGGIAFASEIPALLAVPWIGREIAQDGVIQYLRSGYLSGGTIYSQIQTLAPATTVTFEHSPGGDVSRSYFLTNQFEAGAHKSEGSAAATTRRLVLDAVNRQLVSDVPLGCFLSGGIDSSIVAAAMRAAIPRDRSVFTFTIGFDDPRYDESRYAALVAKHLGTEHRQFTVTPDAAQDLPKIAAAFGEPFGDSSALPTYYLAQHTRQFVKVALSGDGGDEMFGGYDRYRAMRIASRIQSMPLLRSLLQSPLWQHLPGKHPKGRLARLKRLLASLGSDSAQRYESYVSLFDERAMRELLLPDLGIQTSRPGAASMFQEICRGGKEASRRDDVQASLAVDRLTYLPGDLLTKVDRCSMAHALEVRSPFLDSGIVRFAAGLNGDQLLGGGPKRLLREAFAGDLPSFVFKRRKMGFAVPIGDWFRQRTGGLRGLLHDALFSADSFAAAHFRPSAVRQLVESHEAGAADHAQRLYALLMLELWWQGTK